MKDLLITIFDVIMYAFFTAISIVSVLGIVIVSVKLFQLIQSTLKLCG